MAAYLILKQRTQGIVDPALTAAARTASRWGVSWVEWAVVTSPHIPDGLSQVRLWTVPDLLQAHAVIDATETVLEHHRRQAKRRG